MAFTIRLYAPLDAGISYMSVVSWPGGSFLNEQWPPKGVSIPAMTHENVSTRYLITPIMANGSYVVNYRWVVNIDGNVSYYENRQTYEYTPTGTEKLVQIRVEMQGQEVGFFGSVILDANGGSLGSIQAKYVLDGSPERNVLFTLPTGTPTRTGYVFAGWGDKATNPDVVLEGGRSAWAILSAFPPGTETYFYAQWTKKTDGGAMVHNGSAYKKAVPYVHNGSVFKKAVPHIWNGGWKKGV